MSSVDFRTFNKSLAFALFQGDSYGFIGSRAFFTDVASSKPFECDEGAEIEPGPTSYEPGVGSCASPPRTSLAFKDAFLGTISDMLSLDQVGYLATSGVFRTHGYNGADPTGVESCGIAEIIEQTAAEGFVTTPSSVPPGYLPPTPLSSLVALSSSRSSLCGVALTGYDSSFSSPLYRSHLDAGTSTVDLATVCAAATIAARAAVAAARGGSDGVGADVLWASEKIKDVDPDDPFVQALAKCFLEDGDCDIVRTSVEEEAYRQVSRVGYSPGSYRGFGKPPNYYVGVYDMYNSQPYLVSDGRVYGALSNATLFNVEPLQHFMQLRPSALELSLASLLDSFLGSAFVSSDPDGVTALGGGGGTSATNCTSSNPNVCQNVTCSTAYSFPTCAQGKCTCKASHMHVALDAGLRPANGSAPAGFFEVVGGEVGDGGGGATTTPIWTEPNWRDVGVVIFSDGARWKGAAGMEALGWTAFLGMGVAAYYATRIMKKEKIM